MTRIVKILCVLLLSFSVSYAQEMCSVAKSASKKMKFRANPNTTNYDVTYHKLEFKINPAVAFIEGKVTTTFTAKENMNSVIFDLDDNLTVSKVIQNGNSLNFSQNSKDELIITLSNTLIKNASTSVAIVYSGNPKSSGFGSFEQTTHNGVPIIWTLSEPYGAKGWWPCKQDLIDKIDVIDVYITTPKQYVAVSNGLEQSATINGDEKTTHFKHQYPIPAYLIAIAVTNYEVYSHTVANNGKPFPIVNYVYPESKVEAKKKTAVTVDIMKVFSNLFGEYPFAKEKYGHAQFGWGGGMEHTTVSFMGNFGRNLIAHELAHQWFGNKVTCGSWKDIWLNEGFATYLTGLSIESLDDEIFFKNWRKSKINSITSSSSGAVYLSNADTTNVNRVFSGRLSYNKGAMVLHMLRRKLGDNVFFKACKNYLNDNKLAYGYAKTPDLIKHFEIASGMQLDEFFNDWIYNQGHPSYKVEWYQPNAKNIRFKINQTQSHNSVSFFEAEVPIRLKGTNGEVLNIIVDNTINGQTFTKNVPFKVTTLEVDPDFHLISKNNTSTLGVKYSFLEEPNEVIMYPNPVTNILKIKNSNYVKNYTIYNTLGGEILKTSNNRIDFSNFSFGIYYIKVQTESEGFYYKSVIKR